MHRRNTLNPETSTEGSENIEETEEYSGDMRDVTLRAREKYGRYFGICSSYHHLKACVCKYCTSYPGYGGMFCTRGGTVRAEEEKEDCLCGTCELFRKFQIEGDCFCQLREKKNTSKKNRNPLNICTDFQTSAGTIRVCVLDKQNI